MLRGLTLLVLIYLFVAHALPKLIAIGIVIWRGIPNLTYLYRVAIIPLPLPIDVSPAGWRLFGLFAATVVGLIMQPVPGGALVLTAVTLSAVLGGLTIAKALSGYADPTVWLVMAAFFISRSLINTGLARRIALFFVRLFGRSSLGVCYALSASDMILATSSLRMAQGRAA